MRHWSDLPLFEKLIITVIFHTIKFVDLDSDLDIFWRVASGGIVWSNVLNDIQRLQNISSAVVESTEQKSRSYRRYQISYILRNFSKRIFLWKVSPKNRCFLNIEVLENTTYYTYLLANPGRYRRPGFLWIVLALVRIVPITLLNIIRCDSVLGSSVPYRCLVFQHHFEFLLQCIWCQILRLWERQTNQYRDWWWNPSLISIFCSIEMMV